MNHHQARSKVNAPSKSAESPTVKIGLLATLLAPLRAKGTTAPALSRSLLAALLALAATLALGVSKGKAAAPTLAAAPASEIGISATHLSGSVNPQGHTANQAAAAEACPNEAIRIEQGSTYLAACRAYELVNPPGAKPQTAEAAVGGGAVAWPSYLPPHDSAGQAGGGMYLSRRGADSWSTIGVTPPQSPEAGLNTNCAPTMFFSPSLAQGVLTDGELSASLAGNGEEACGAHNEPSLVSEPAGWQSEPEGVQNLFLADLGDQGPAAWRLINRTPTGVIPADARFEDASTEEHDEFSHVVFEENAPLTDEAPSGNDLYEWFNGAVRLVTQLPNGQSAGGTLANAPVSITATGGAGFTNALSEDGSRVLFVSEGNLYVRMHADHESSQGALGAAECLSSEHACTIQVDASQAGGPGGGGTFLTANNAGTKVFFIDSPAAQLTSDTETGSGENLYEYEVATGTLVDLTGDEADVNVLGYSGFGEQPDGSYDLYFVAEGALRAGATVGRPNLYVADESGGKLQMQYIATLNPEDNAGTRGSDWGSGKEIVDGQLSIEFLTTRVSPDGRMITFNSIEAQAIAGYDNTPAHEADCTGGIEYGSQSGLCREIFVYEVGAPKPTCVSCHWGSTPAGPNTIKIPLATQNRTGPVVLNKNVSNGGSVFFDSPDALVNEDVNGVSDVYEFHEDQVHLISSGTGTEASAFHDASADGGDAFFTTSQRLLSGDAGDGVSLYDARRAGGFAEPAPPPECDADGCRPSSAGAFTLPVPASAALAGSGNVAPTRKQMLSRALKVCKRRLNKRKRERCERQARQKYGSKTPSTRRRGGVK
jgi:hypothetical protein